MLHEIIAVADFINHAILTAKEMHHSLNRLVSGKLISVDRAGRWTATRRASVLNQQVEKCCKRDVQDQLEGLERLMNCPCCGVRLKTVRWRVRLDQAMYDQAIKQYKDMWPTMGKK